MDGALVWAIAGTALLLLGGIAAIALAADAIPDCWIDPKHLRGDAE